MTGAGKGPSRPLSDQRGWGLESRLLSSRATYLCKIGALCLTALWILLSADALARSRDPAGLDFLMPAVGLIVFLTIYLLVGRCKRVELLGHVFIVSSGSRTIEIPIREVDFVGGSRFARPERIWLALREPSDFGSRIHFLPPPRLLGFFSAHPLVAELQSIVERGESAGAGPADPWPDWRWIVTGTAGVLAFAGLLLALVMGAFRSSDPYRMAVAAVEPSPAARQQLGAPIEPGWLVLGSIRAGFQSGRAVMRIPVSGPRDEGTLRVEAARKAGVWKLTLLRLEVAGRTTNLLED